jgi:hypothetical protein
MRANTMSSKVSIFTLSVMFSAIFASSAFAAESAGEPGRSSGKANPLNNVYFGEQHLHSGNSMDAFTMGTKNTPDDSFDYCKGKKIKKMTFTSEKNSQYVQRKTPYDWCAVTDHAYLLGMLPAAQDAKNPLSKTPMGKEIFSGTPEGLSKAYAMLIEAGLAGGSPEGFGGKAAQLSWKDQVDIINKHNDPGKFTTIIAYEWTSLPYGQNLHRNVFFRDDVGPEVTFSAVDSDRPEDLWNYQAIQRLAGHENFAVIHNSNLSNGLMFAPLDSYGNFINRDYAKTRALNEVAVEMAQTKGSSETHPALSPNDEFANFELNTELLNTKGARGKVENSYVRQGLIDGVGYQEYLGVNPFKLGVVAGADSHTAFSVNEEFNYTGVHGFHDDTPAKRLAGTTQPVGQPAIFDSSANTTAVWAPENTRTAIFDGIKRRETYGTSGTLIRLRFFGGWDYDKSLDKDKDFVGKAYAQGVPMGQDLPKKAAKAPTFVVWAQKDPDSGNLDRIQIVKGWYAGGYSREKVYDVAWSDNRKPMKNGKLPPVGNTVNIKEASYTNNIGDNVLSTTWVDPEFDESQHAVYYARVLEIPTPRWTAYDAKALGIAHPEGVPATFQERAWSSPIWYTPEAELVKKANWYPGLLPYLDQ